MTDFGSPLGFFILLVACQREQNRTKKMIDVNGILNIILENK